MDNERTDLQRLHAGCEEIRQAALATDARVGQARHALRDVTAAYRVLCERLVDAQLQELARRGLGNALERAAVALNEPTP